jgi:hypothetical protein
MQNEEREKFIFEFLDDILSELNIQKEIESYDKIMEQRPKYKICYNLGLAFDFIRNKEKAEDYYNRNTAL